MGTAAPPAAAPTAAAAVSAPPPGRTVAESGGAAKSDLRGALSTIETYRGQDPTADPASAALTLAPALPGTPTPALGATIAAGTAALELALG